MLFSQRLLALFAVLLLLLPAAAGAKNYWHFTFKAFVDPGDNAGVEWAWVTMVEMPKARAYPEEAATIRRMGGKLEGTVLALVRAAAWRAEHTRHLERDKTISWSESNSESVYATGQLYDGGEFSFGITSRRHLREDGSWFDPRSRSHVFLGPITRPGEPEKRIKGSFVVRGVNYEDPVEHHRSGDKEWIRQYISGFRFFEINSLRERMEPGENSVFGQTGHSQTNIVYQVERSTSRTHPHWKRQEM